nr:glycosyltransferase family 2 protein [uncultured Trichococcus sp.]
MKGKVSVIIPTYKREVKFLKRAVESVLCQTYDDFEIIIIDDSPSSYEFRSEVKKYVNLLNSIKVIYIENEMNVGGALSRNKGIESATGEYITFLDDDDKYLPKKIENQIQFMIDGNYDLSFTNMVMHNDKEEVVDVREYHDIPSFENEFLLKYHLMKHLTGTPTFMFKSNKLKEIGGFEDAKMGQEFYLMLKSIEKGFHIGYFDKCDLIVYKHKEGGITQGKNKIVGENNLYNFKKNYFDRLSMKEKMFIRFRHYAVMVVAYKRNNMNFNALASGIIAFFVSPFDFVNEVSGFVLKILKSRRNWSE